MGDIIKEDGFTRASRCVAVVLTLGRSKGMTTSACAWDRRVYCWRWRLLARTLDRFWLWMGWEEYHCLQSWRREAHRYAGAMVSHN